MAVFLWEAHPLYPFILLLNRDEFHSRETKKLGWWGGRRFPGFGRKRRVRWRDVAPAAGRSLSSPTAARNLPTRSPPAASCRVRGRGGEGGVRVQRLQLRTRGRVLQVHGLRHQWGDIGFGRWRLPRRGGPAWDARAFECLPRHPPWPKAQRLRECFGEYVLRNSEAQELRSNEMVMTNSIRDEDASLLPGILSPEWEFAASSVFVDFHTPLGRYGTRSTSILSVNTSGRVEFYERHLFGEIDRYEEHTVSYQIDRDDCCKC